MSAGRIVALIAARLLAPHTKLATTRWWHSTTLAEEFAVSDADEQDLVRCDGLASWSGRGRSRRSLRRDT